MLAWAVPEVPLQCVVAARSHNPMLFSASLCDPCEPAVLEGTILKQGLVALLELQKAGRSCRAD